MKTLKTALSALVLVAGVLFTSCKKSDNTTNSTTSTPNNPSINFVGGTGYISSDYTVTAGSALKVAWNANYNSTSKSYLSKIYRSTTSNNIIVDSNTVNFTSSSNTQSYRDSIVATAPSVTVTTAFHFQVTVTDKAGLTSSISLNLTVVPTPPATMAIGSGAITLGGSVDTNPSYMNLYNGTTYSSSTANANASSIDMVYNKTKVYSPSDPLETNATIKAAGVITKMDVYTAKAYSAITASDIAAYVPSGATNVTLASGTVVMFKTAGGKNGVFQVSAFNGSATSATTDNITIVGQVQQ